MRLAIPILVLVFLIYGSISILNPTNESQQFPELLRQDFGTATPIPELDMTEIDTINIENLRELIQLDGYEKVTSTDFKFNSHVVAFGTTNGLVNLWSIDEASLTPIHLNSPYTIQDVEFSPDGDLLAFSDENNFAVWRIDPLERVGAGGRGDTIHDIAFNLDPTIVVFGGEGASKIIDNFVVAEGGGSIDYWDWDSEGDPLVLRILEIQGVVNGIAFNPDGTLLAAGVGGEDSVQPGGWVHILDAETGEIIQTFDGFEGGVNDVEYSLNGQFIAMASSDDTVGIWETQSEQFRFIAENESNGVNTVAFSANNALLAAGGNNGVINFWDVNSGEKLHTITLDTQAEIWEIDFSPDGLYMATAGEDGIFRVWWIPSY